MTKLLNLNNENAMVLLGLSFKESNQIWKIANDYFLHGLSSEILTDDNVLTIHNLLLGW